MRNKLKKLFLSSVDTCRAGANQEADICLFKSADGGETYTQELPIDDGTFLAYSDALAKSIMSINEDDSLDEAGKAEMIQKSFEQFNAAVEKVNSVGEEDPEEQEDPISDDEPADETPAPEYDVIVEIESKKA